MSFFAEDAIENFTATLDMALWRFYQPLRFYFSPGLGIGNEYREGGIWLCLWRNSPVRTSQYNLEEGGWKRSLECRKDMERREKSGNQQKPLYVFHCDPVFQENRLCHAISRKSLNNIPLPVGMFTEKITALINCFIQMLCNISSSLV